MEKIEFYQSSARGHRKLLEIFLSTIFSNYNNECHKIF